MSDDTTDEVEQPRAPAASTAPPKSLPTVVLVLREFRRILEVIPKTAASINALAWPVLALALLAAIVGMYRLSYTDGDGRTIGPGLTVEEKVAAAAAAEAEAGAVQGSGDE